LGCTYDYFPFLDHISKRLGSDQFITDSDTTQTAYAEVVIPDEKGLIFLCIKMTGNITGQVFLDPYILGDLPQLTRIKKGTASLLLRYIGGTLSQAASFALGAHQTSVGMLGQYGSQIIPAKVLQLT
jgi:hypothetical protein